MDEQTEKIYARLAAMDREIANLRQGYVIVNKRYTEALASLRRLITHATDAARKSSQAAQKAEIACRNAASAAHEAAEQHVISAAAAADAASASARNIKR